MTNEPTPTQIAGLAGHAHRHATVLDQSAGALLEIVDGLMTAMPPRIGAMSDHRGIIGARIAIVAPQPEPTRPGPRYGLGSKPTYELG